MTKQISPQTTSKKPPQKRLSKRRAKKTLLKQLVDFYWQILDDPELKPSDRIASAKRLESLLNEGPSQDEKPQVTVILNIPPAHEETS